MHDPLTALTMPSKACRSARAELTIPFSDRRTAKMERRDRHVDRRTSKTGWRLPFTDDRTAMPERMDSIAECRTAYAEGRDPSAYVWTMKDVWVGDFRRRVDGEGRVGRGASPTCERSRACGQRAFVDV
jgi:hypothetical protein